LHKFWQQDSQTKEHDRAVVFVETVRAYYDVLLRLAKPYYGVQLQAAQ
jgi:hypothetical protein